MLCFVLVFFPDWSAQETTPTESLPKTSSSPSDSTQPPQEQFTTASSATAKPDNSCFQNITVVYPVSRFCSRRADGLYMRSDNPKTFYRCVQRKTFVTKCHTLGTEHSSAGTTIPSKNLVIVTFVIATLFHLLIIWNNRWFCFVYNSLSKAPGLLWKEKWYKNVNPLTLPIRPSEATKVHAGKSCKYFKYNAAFRPMHTVLSEFLSNSGQKKVKHLVNPTH